MECWLAHRWRVISQQVHRVLVPLSDITVPHISPEYHIQQAQERLKQEDQRPDRRERLNRWFLHSLTHSNPHTCTDMHLMQSHNNYVRQLNCCFLLVAVLSWPYFISVYLRVGRVSTCSTEMCLVCACILKRHVYWYIEMNRNIFHL